MTFDLWWGCRELPSVAKVGSWSGDLEEVRRRLDGLVEARIHQQGTRREHELCRREALLLDLVASDDEATASRA